MSKPKLKTTHPTPLVTSDDKYVYCGDIRVLNNYNDIHIVELMFLEDYIKSVKKRFNIK